jgi:hypothetical protein
MTHLVPSGSYDLAQAILKRWDYAELWSTRTRSDYWRKFPCPKCGADGWESLTERKTRRNKFGEEWVIEQGGECDHVHYDRYVLVTCQAVDVTESGRIVAIVEPDPGEPVYWLRYESVYRDGKLDVDELGPLTVFGTLFQARTATTEESRALRIAEGEEAYE